MPGPILVWCGLGGCLDGIGGVLLHGQLSCSFSNLVPTTVLACSFIDFHGILKGIPQAMLCQLIISQQLTWNSRQ